MDSANKFHNESFPAIYERNLRNRTVSIVSYPPIKIRRSPIQPPTDQPSPVLRITISDYIEDEPINVETDFPEFVPVSYEQQFSFWYPDLGRLEDVLFPEGMDF